MAERSTLGPARAKPEAVYITAISATGEVTYTVSGGPPLRAKLHGIQPPKEAEGFVRFANYMTRGQTVTLVHKVQRAGVAYVQVVLSDGRDLGYLMILGRYASPTPPEQSPPMLYLTARRQHDPNAVESLAAKPITKTP